MIISSDRGRIRTLILIALGLFLIGLVVAAGFIGWGYYYITRDLPSFEAIEEYAPSAVSRVYAADGTLVAEFFKERRYQAKLSEIPLITRNCFLAAEDTSFYSHPGINPLSILRAMIRNFQTGSAKQGGSTITQQVVKNLLLTPEKKLERKIKEAILSYRLEHVLTKDQILELYLNQIYFGNTAYGIKAAALAYFHKQPAELTLAESAMLAGLPQAPSRYSPISHFQKARERQHYVLKRMVEAGFVTEEIAQAAMLEDVQVYKASNRNIYYSPFYVSEVRRVLAERWPDRDIDSEGLEIYTALDLKADAFAKQAMQRGLREVDKRRGWRGPRARIPGMTAEEYQQRFEAEFSEEQWSEDDVYPALVREIRKATGRAAVLVNTIETEVDLRGATWAKKILSADSQTRWDSPENVLQPGDIIEVAWKAPSKSGPAKFTLDQTPELEGASLMLDPHNGRVMSVIGGFSYQRSQFNRATQSERQPGSAFKPIVYLAAVDGFRYTPATIVYDEPRSYRVGDDFWSPGNFDEEFLGPITLRTALEKSRNLVSANIVSGIGVDAVIEYARKLGVVAKLGRNPSLSLGSSELTMLELARAYGVFPAKGLLYPSVFVTKITDRQGNIIYDNQSELASSARQVIPETSAFVMTNMLRGVVEHGTGQKVKELGRPAAGKTGTSNDQMDAWFVGFTPSLVNAVWVGFDAKKEIGDKETGGRVAAPIWVDAVKSYLDYLDSLKPEPKDPPETFAVPEGVDAFWVDKQTGILAEPEAQGAILEYFVHGTEPRRTDSTESAVGYLDAPEL